MKVLHVCGVVGKEGPYGRRGNGEGREWCLGWRNVGGDGARMGVGRDRERAWRSAGTGIRRGLGLRTDMESVSRRDALQRNLSPQGLRRAEGCERRGGDEDLMDSRDARWLASGERQGLPVGGEERVSW